MTKLFLLNVEHESATRVPDKPLRPFGDTCLFDIYLSKLEAIFQQVWNGVPEEERLLVDAAVALWPGDKRLIEKADDADIPRIDRNEASRNAHNDLATQFNFLKDIDCDWFLWPNGCAPFLKVETILEIARRFHEGEPRPITTVREKRGWIWDERGCSINEHAGSTQDTEPYYESTYNVHVFNKHDLVKYGHYWNQDAPVEMYVMKDEIETMDIDTMDDFAACEKVWREQHE